VLLLLLRYPLALSCLLLLEEELFFLVDVLWTDREDLDLLRFGSKSLSDDADDGLRCRDLERPERDLLSWDFSSPSTALTCLRRTTALTCLRRRELLLRLRLLVFLVAAVPMVLTLAVPVVVLVMLSLLERETLLGRCCDDDTLRVDFE
jgi:hypothetical protein